MKKLTRRIRRNERAFDHAVRTGSPAMQQELYAAAARTNQMR